jgi:hypothetical protein
MCLVLLYPGNTLDFFHIDRLTKIFAEIGAADWLEAHPLSRLELTHHVMRQGIYINGLYDFLERTLKIATTRDPNEYGKIFEWQRVYAVSSTGQTPTEAVQMTLVHELGHPTLERNLNPKLSHCQRVFALAIPVIPSV